MNNSPLYVTTPFLPPLEEYVDLLKGIWNSGILTHNGPLVQQFEKVLIEKLGVSSFTAMSNGTIAIQSAIKALRLHGEIITTPFTWIATISAIKWERCKPVFCDIDPDTFNIDAAKIEACITENTVAIMPVHVFGNPCDVEAIQKIAYKHGLKVIYDAAHAVGSKINGESILNFGDISATSFHATKILNTAEGGGCVTRDPDLADKLSQIRFFGHDQTKDIVTDGFNGKMNELQAALGLSVIRYLDKILEERKEKAKYYNQKLARFSFMKFQRVDYGETNFSYFPVVFDNEERLVRVEKNLNAANIFPRRYFYPSVNTFTAILENQHMPVSEDIAGRILCLPLFSGITFENIDQIISKIAKS